MNCAPRDLPMFANGVVGFGPAPELLPYLIGGHCTLCALWVFPWAEHCSSCYGQLAKVSLGTRGVVYSFTIVRIKPPLGLSRPYAVAYIDLAERPLRIFMLIDPIAAQSMAIGQEVELAVASLGVDRQGSACRRPLFRPVERPGNQGSS